MRQRDNARDVVDLLEQRLRKLERQAIGFSNFKVPTVPIYGLSSADVGSSGYSGDDNTGADNPNADNISDPSYSDPSVITNDDAEPVGGDDYGTSPPVAGSHTHEVNSTSDDAGYFIWVTPTTRNLSIVSDYYAGDGTALQWSNPAFSSFSSMITQCNSVGNNNLYQWDFLSADPPKPTQSVQDMVLRVRARGTDPGTTYRLSVGMVAATIPNDYWFVTSGQPQESGFGAAAELVWTQTFSGTAYQELLFGLRYDSIGGYPNLYFYGWYLTGGAGNLLIDNLKLDFEL